MKIIRTADNKMKLRMSKNEWERIGVGNKWICAKKLSEVKKAKKARKISKQQ